MSCSGSCLKPTSAISVTYSAHRQAPIPLCGDAGQKLPQSPNVIGQSSFHCWCHAQRFVYPAEVVIREVQGASGFVVYPRGKEFNGWVLIQWVVAEFKPF